MERIAFIIGETFIYWSSIILVFAAVTLIMFIVLFVIIGSLSSKVSSLNDRLSESEEYINAMNTRTYKYAQPGDVVYIPHDNISEYNVFVRKLIPTAQFLSTFTFPALNFVN